VHVNRKIDDSKNGSTYFLKRSPEKQYHGHHITENNFEPLTPICLPYRLSPTLKMRNVPVMVFRIAVCISAVSTDGLRECGYQSRIKVGLGKGV
jgi:hypothetical protein